VATSPEQAEELRSKYGDLDANDRPSVVIGLSSSNFETLTQATTGSTTGDWFIEFYAPWCGHCKSLKPTWEDLAYKLLGEVNVAAVDGTAESDLAKRFKIQGFPTLIYLSHGEMYEYAGDRKLDTLLDYAQGGFKQQTSKPIPKPLTAIDMVLDSLNTLVGDFQLVFTHKPVASSLLIVLGFLVGLISSVVVFACFIDKKLPKPASTVAAGAGDKKKQ